MPTDPSEFRVQLMPSADVEVSAVAEVMKRCPVKDEIDDGTVKVTWRAAAGVTLELHSLAEYLRGWRHVAVSHEDFTARVARDLSRTLGQRVTASTAWNTARMSVAVSTP